MPPPLIGTYPPISSKHSRLNNWHAIELVVIVFNGSQHLLDRINGISRIFFYFLFLDSIYRICQIFICLSSLQGIGPTSWRLVARGPISNPKNIKIARYSINFCDLSLYLRFGQIRPKSVRLLGEVNSSTFLNHQKLKTIIPQLLI